MFPCFFSTQETSLNKICLPAGSNNACEQIPSSWLHANMDVLPGVIVPVFIEFIGLTAVFVRVENRTSKRAKKGSDIPMQVQLVVALQYALIPAQFRHMSKQVRCESNRMPPLL